MPRLTKDQQIADMLSGFEVREARLRALAKDLLFAVDVTEPEAVLLGRFLDILRRAAPAVGEATDHDAFGRMTPLPDEAVGEDTSTGSTSCACGVLYMGKPQACALHPALDLDALARETAAKIVAENYAAWHGYVGVDSPDNQIVPIIRAALDRVREGQ